MRRSPSWGILALASLLLALLSWQSCGERTRQKSQAGNSQINASIKGDNRSCTDRGRLFAEGARIPSNDSCNVCACTCEGTLCQLHCTNEVCPDALDLAGEERLVFDINGNKRPLNRPPLSCNKTEICNIDQEFVEACRAAKGTAVDDGCCTLACTLKVTIKPAKSANPDRCLVAKDKLAGLVDALTVDDQDQGVASRRHHCREDSDCLLIIPDPLASCPQHFAISADAFAAIAANWEEARKDAELYCPRYESPCPPPIEEEASCIHDMPSGMARQAGVLGICGLRSRDQG